MRDGGRREEGNKKRQNRETEEEDDETEKEGEKIVKGADSMLSETERVRER